uniref:Macaca fascicularis brain cDNA, clone: QflA-22181 n=1 Tax=Macaca fascicularis TaxID=9541 RepID=I7GIS1_MACFA|nr:unnamed protein product [Macaca fascicularis]
MLKCQHLFVIRVTSSRKVSPCFILLGTWFMLHLVIVFYVVIYLLTD